LDYAVVYQNSTEKVKEFDLNFLKKGTKYKNVNGIDRIFFNSKDSIKLTESASGFQSVIPIVLPIQNEKSNYREHYSFVIEEPETNLFPKAQYELLKFLEKDRSDDFDKIDQGIIHTYTTHSPFILSSLNNMLYAFKKGNLANDVVKDKISKVLNKNNWINPSHFSAYQIENGKAKSIMDRTSGLIKDNVIDYVSEDIIDDFRKIASASIQ
jgi:predicted ATPase